MSEHIDQTINALRQKIGDHEQSIVKIKTTINQLLELDGRSPMFADAELQGSSSTAHIRKDAFFGKPLATCVRIILQMREAQGAATADEVYDSLVAGGFDFEEKAEALAKRNLAISLGKNALFMKTPNGLWGLREWYPTAVKAKSARLIVGAGVLAAGGTASSKSALAQAAAAAANNSADEETDPLTQ